jgi:hypothetical protein
VQPDFSKIPLHDIHLPPPVSWWPPAVGWWLMLFSVVAIIALVWWQVRRYRRLKIRRSALKELNALYKIYQSNYDARYFARELSVLLRRICISYFPQGPASGLTGTAWLAYLDSLLSSKHNKSGHKFSDGVGVVIIRAPYQNTLNDGAINVDALYRLCTEWIYSMGQVGDRSAPPKTASVIKSNQQSVPAPLEKETLRASKEAAHVSV